MIHFAFTLLGLLIGSFLNVVIYRWPKNESIAYPASHCTNCKSHIKWYDNIPVLSYILLKGKCRNCKTKISIRYPMVELLTALLFLLTYHLTGLNFHLIINLILVIVFIIIVFIDIDYYIIPDTMTLTIAILAIINIVLNLMNDNTYNYLSHIYGLVFGFGLLFLIRFISTKIYKKEAMGFGDVKLLGALGLLLGLKGTILTFILSFVIAAFIEVFLLKIKVKSKENEIAFGPYLIIAAFIAYYFGIFIINGYLELLGF